MAQSLAGYLDLRHITGLSGADLEVNVTSAKGFAAGQPIWMYDAIGLRMFTLVQNRTSAAMVRGQLVSRLGNNNGVTIVTNSVATTTQITFGLAALTTNAHVGSVAYISSVSAPAATVVAEGEASVVVSNASNAVNMDPRYPYSAAPTAATLCQVLGTYNAEAAATNDTNLTCMGAVMGQNGISTGNFGFVQSVGPNFRVLKDLASTANVLTTGSSIVVMSGSGSCSAPMTAGTAFNLVIGKALAPASSVSVEAFIALHCGLGISAPFTTGQVS